MFRTAPREHWLRVLREARVPAAPVADVADVLADPHVRHREMVVELGGVEVPGNPVKLSDHTDAWREPPSLGQHTDEVLGLLGLDGAAIAGLRRQGVVA